MRVDSEQRANFHRQRNLLARLANRRLLHRLAEIHEPARNRPSMRKILALDQYDLVANLGNHIVGDGRTLRTRHIHNLTRVSAARLTHSRSMTSPSPLNIISRESLGGFSKR